MKRFFVPTAIILFVLPLFLFSCEEKKEYIFADDTLLMSIENVPITYDLYRFYYLSMRDNYESFDKSSQEELKEQCIEAVKFYASLYVFASRSGITLNDDDYVSIKAQVADYENFYGQDGYSDMLSELYHTRSSHYLTIEWQFLRKKCAQSLEISEDDVTVLVRTLMNELDVEYKDAFDLLEFEKIV